MSTGEPEAVRSRWSALPLFSAGPWGCTPANPPQGQREDEKEREREREREETRQSTRTCHSGAQLSSLSLDRGYIHYPPLILDPERSTGCTALNYRNVLSLFLSPLDSRRWLRCLLISAERSSDQLRWNRDSLFLEGGIKRI